MKLDFLCARCGRLERFDYPLGGNASMAAIDAHLAGWRPLSDRHLCPKCSGTNDPNTLPASRGAGLPDRR